MNVEKIKRYIPHFLLFKYEKFRIRQRNSPKNTERIYAQWLSGGKQIPPPHIVKQKAIESFKERFNLNTLVETGTFLGDMAYSQRNNFKRIISIELDEVYFKDAREKFKDCNNIEIIHGDSGKVLKQIINKQDEPCLFWLDGHYSAGFTAKGELETPILAELETILNNDFQHVVLIDDARCFTGKNDYPAIGFLEKYMLDMKKGYEVDIIDDIIRFYPDINT